MVKTAGRTLEEFDLHLAFPADYHTNARPKPEGFTAPSAKDKKRSLFRRWARR
jgi:hypothetical protein